MSVKRETVEERKAMPLASGVLDYFPDALLVVAEVSRVGNEQHHPGEPLHWDKSKSTDEADALLRHLLDRGTRDTDGLRHSGKVAWRALALLQRELDAEAIAAEPVNEADAHDSERCNCGVLHCKGDCYVHRNRPGSVPDLSTGTDMEIPPHIHPFSDPFVVNGCPTCGLNPL